MTTKTAAVLAAQQSQLVLKQCRRWHRMSL
eukprot:COSAG02_NODE_18885_length_912_cov_1.118081_1_plen_29_part_10